MNKRSLTLFVALLLAGTGTTFAGVWGFPDQVPAATLIVPMIESGITFSSHPHDTLPVVYNQTGSTVTIHWELWSIDAQQSDGLFGNVDIPGFGTWSGSMRDIMSSASANDQARMTQGAFYRGFMTIDLVTENTFSTPFATDYPFRNDNILNGYTYYVRLAEGSSNGLPMVHLESVDVSADFRQEGFYAASTATTDGLREEIDPDARACAEQLSQGLSCTGTDDGDADVIRARLFLQPPTGDSRIVVFAWDTSQPQNGGPSVICGELGTCPTSYIFRRFGLDGTQLENRQISLNNVVNIIDPIGSGSGEALIFPIPSPNSDTQLYAFVFNSFTPVSGTASWDAIFEASIVP